MPIALPIDDEESQIEEYNPTTLSNITTDPFEINSTPIHTSPTYQLLIFLARFKYLRVPILNWTILFLFLFMIFRLISKYESMYSENRLLTSITANCLLYGLSDSLAQSISCYLANVSSRSETGAVIRRRSSVNSIILDSLHGSDAMFTDYGDTSSLHEEPTGMLKDVPHHQILSKQTDADIFNFRRFVGFIVWGFFMAFVQVAWYWVLNHFYTKEPTLVSVLERVLTDQLLFSPISLFSFFTYSNFVLEGGDKYTLHQKIQRIYITTLSFNYMVWPLVQFINFLVMPKRFQVPFSSSSKY